MTWDNYDVKRVDGKLFAVNLNTGDCIGPLQERDGKPIIHGKRSAPFGRGGLTMFNDWMQSICEDDLTMREVKVFLHVLRNLEFENVCRLTHQQIADALKLHRPDVTKALNRLTTKGYLTKRDNIHYLPLYFGWKGSRENYHAQLRKAAV